MTYLFFYSIFLDKILEVINKEKVSGIIAGYPYNLDGTESEQSTKTLIFLHGLSKRTPLDILLFDERFSTSSALHGLSPKKRREYKTKKKFLDNAAACYILQDYLLATEWFEK